ncbi:MAG: chlorite dismutase family protein [Nitrospiraceae bacterium]
MSGHGQPQGQAPAQGAPQAPQRRQFCNFVFYRVDPAWRRLPEAERTRGKEEFIRAVEEYQGRVLVIPYTTVGIRPETDIMLWRISYDLELFQEMSSKIMASGLGKYISTPYSYLSMTKRSIYVDNHSHEGQESKRLTIVPGRSKYIFVYPFLKTREWFLLTKAARQGMMDEHIEVGHRFPSVKLNTTYSFGLDDQEWVVAFESDKPEDFLDLVMALRETEGSRYTLRDTPIFTCIKKNLKDTLETLGG